MRVKRITIQVELPDKVGHLVLVDELLRTVREVLKDKPWPNQAQAFWDISENERIGDVTRWPPHKAGPHEHALHWVDGERKCAIPGCAYAGGGEYLD